MGNMLEAAYIVGANSESTTDLYQITVGPGILC
jgi:hypothetical protein